jgi:hypothetical protein
MTSTTLPEFDPRFDTAPITDEDTRNETTARRQRKSAQRDREERAKMVADRGLQRVTECGVLVDVPRKFVADFFRIRQHTTLRSVISRNGAELVAAGWDPATDMFSPSAVATIALLLRPQTSAGAARIQQDVNPAASMPRIKFDGGARHREFCSAIYGTAAELIEDVRDIDAGEVWARVRDLDDYEKTALVVTLAALVLDEHPNTGVWVKSSDPDAGTHPLGGSLSGGLSTLIPTPETAHGVPLSVAAPVDDAAVGL